MLSFTRLTFYDAFSVIWIRFFSQFCLIFHSWIWIRIPNADPDPGRQSNADPDPGRQSNADPDPEHWQKEYRAGHLSICRQI
jgi:hypothetical protein